MLSVHYFCVKISQLLTCNVKASLIKIALPVVAFSFNEWTASSFVQNGNDIFTLNSTTLFITVVHVKQEV